MSETIRIKRQRVIEYDFQESIDLTTEEYEQLVAELGCEPNDAMSPEMSAKADEIIDRIIGESEWETDWSEAAADRITNLWRTDEDE